NAPPGRPGAGVRQIVLDERSGTWCMVYQKLATSAAREITLSTELKLEPVDASFSLKEHIYGVLKASIMELDIYDPTTSLRMDERRLAEGLGISRTPVREALMRLEQEGFVETRARRGVYIRRKSLDEILEMITVWAALESMAARLACTEATEEEIAELRRIGGIYTATEASARIQEYSERNID